MTLWQANLTRTLQGLIRDVLNTLGGQPGANSVIHLLAHLWNAAQDPKGFSKPLGSGPLIQLSDLLPSGQRARENVQ